MVNLVRTFLILKTIHSFVAKQPTASYNNIYNIILTVAFEMINHPFCFTGSVKKSVRKTATEFMSLVPMFSQRLAQRDYDFILIPPYKKRMLMKMYIMGES